MGVGEFHTVEVEQYPPQQALAKPDPAQVVSDYFARLDLNVEAAKRSLQEAEQRFKAAVVDRDDERARLREVVAQATQENAD